MVSEASPLHPQAAGVITLTASDSIGDAPGTSGNLTIVAGLVRHFAIIGVPTQTTAGSGTVTSR